MTAEEPTLVPTWVRTVRWVLLVGIWIFLAGILVQAYLAGRGAFGAGTFGPHMDVGWVLAHNVGPLLLILSFLARMGWKLHTMAAVGFVIGAIVPILAAAGADAPDVGAVHPLSAVLAFALLLWVEWRLRPLVIAPPPEASATASREPSA